MTSRQGKRDFLISVTVWGLLVVFTLITGILLIWFGWIRFPWTDQILQKFNYQRNKSRSFRVLVLGDSQLEEWPMEHCLYKDMERFCAQNRWGYVNLAHHGFGPLEYRNRFREFATDYKPQLVLVFYYAGNDLTDMAYRQYRKPSQPQYGYVLTGSRIRYLPREGFKNDREENNMDTGSGFGGHSWDEFIENGIDPVMIEYAKNRIRHPYRIGAEYVNPHLLVMGYWKPEYLTDNILRETLPMKHACYQTLREFEGMLGLADFLAARVWFVSIPSPVQVDTVHNGFFRKLNFRVPEHLIHSSRPQELLREYAEASGCDHLDLLPHFRQHAEASSLYFENDDHLSEAGHMLAYSLIESMILDRMSSGHEKTAGGWYRPGAHLEYRHWEVEYQMERIRQDSTWLAAVIRKAADRSISVDSMLQIDAGYLVDQEESSSVIR
ncbi:MAG: SGNH/GDSL hydrolase family protein [Bacteroidales bacterium]|nr:SGNH/GDSL hydrolase family protein [Bacteroidales bacterium]